MVEEDAFHRQLYAVQERLPKGDILMVIDDLNAKASSGNI